MSPAIDNEPPQSSATSTERPRPLDRKLLLPAAIVVAAAAAVVGLIIGRLAASSPDPAPPPTVTITATPSATATQPPTASPTPTLTPSAGASPYSRTAATKRRWEPVVVGFAKNYVTTDVKGDRAWAAGLTPYTTPALGRQLAAVNRLDVPDGRYRDYRIAEHGQTSLTVTVRYRAPGPDWGLVLYLTLDRGRWRIWQYDRYGR